MNYTVTGFPPGRAVIFNGHGLPFEITTHHIPAISPGEIIVKTMYTTLCGSDIHTYCGRRQEPPHVVLGHEIVGEILWMHPDHPAIDARGTKVEKGDRIAWSIFAVPEGIAPPKPGMPQKSEQLFKYGHAPSNGNDIFNGGLADYCILKANTCFVKINRHIPEKVAATISCAHATVTGALRIAGNITNKKILVFGAGLLGLSCVTMCKEAGAAWIGITDTDNVRLQWAPMFGSTALYPFLHANNAPLPWPEVDIVFDMTGNPEAMKMGVDSLALGGIAIWIGAVFPAAAVQVDAQKIVRRLLQVRGLHNYNYEDFLNAASFIETNYDKYPFEKLVEKEYLLEDVEKAFEFASESKPVRVGIKIN